MAYHTYHTDCMVLRSVAMGESSRYLTLFTRELGLVRAVGRSLRAANSKLRPHLQDYALARASLVRGRDVWRVTGAETRYNIYLDLEGTREKQLVMLRVSSLLLKLLRGEEVEDPELFDLTLRGLTFLRETSLAEDLTRDFEYVFVIRILSRLGYVGEHASLGGLISSSSFSRSILLSLASHRRDAVLTINRALEASDL